MTLNEIRNAIHEEVLRLRSIENLLNKQVVDRLWEDSDEKQKSELLLFLQQQSVQKLQAWIKCHSSVDLIEKPIKDFKEIARQLQIYNWSRKSKSELINDIRKHEEDEKAGLSQQD